MINDAIVPCPYNKCQLFYNFMLTAFHVTTMFCPCIWDTINAKRSWPNCRWADRKLPSSHIYQYGGFDTTWKFIFYQTPLWSFMPKMCFVFTIWTKFIHWVMYTSYGYRISAILLLSKCKRMETSGRELNTGYHIFIWKFFTQKGVYCLWIIHSKKRWYCDHKISNHFLREFHYSKSLSCM